MQNSCEQLVGSLVGDRIIVMRDDKGLFVRRKIATGSIKYVLYCNLAVLENRHPNVLMIIRILKHRREVGISDIDTELADAGSLDNILPKIPIAFRQTFCLAVVSQILQGLLYFKQVHGRTTLPFNSQKVLVRKDGCVKLNIENFCYLLPIESAFYSSDDDDDYDCNVDRGQILLPSTHRSRMTSSERTSRNSLRDVAVIMCEILTGRTLTTAEAAVVMTDSYRNPPEKPFKWLEYQLSSAVVDVFNVCVNNSIEETLATALYYENLSKRFHSHVIQLTNQNNGPRAMIKAIEFCLSEENRCWRELRGTSPGETETSMRETVRQRQSSCWADVSYIIKKAYFVPRA